MPLSNGDLVVSLSQIVDRDGYLFGIDTFPQRAVFLVFYLNIILKGLVCRVETPVAFRHVEAQHGRFVADRYLHRLRINTAFAVVYRQRSGVKAYFAQRQVRVGGVDDFAEPIFRINFPSIV